MNPTERRASFALAGIMSVRMLGLFMILPVFSPYAEHLPNVTPLLVGIAIGVYGLAQAVLQIPLGLLSDRIGRKQVITGGLLVFALGSVIAALSNTIEGIIIGRAIQGAGAISAALMALTADLTREEHRTKAMAIIGMSIGMAFMTAMILGPMLNQWIGVPGIFWFIAVCALAAIAILHLFVPTPIHPRIHSDAETVPSQFKRVLNDPELLRLDASIFLLHMQLTALFVVLPLALTETAQMPAGEHWIFYLPIMIFAFAAMIPFIIIAEKRRKMKPLFIITISLLVLVQLGFGALHNHLYGILAMLFLFFVAFNFLEASLPSLVSKTAPAQSKGTAMGVYNTGQFLGIFLGGLGGGWLHQHYSISAVFWGCAVISGIWLLITLGMRNPRYLSSHLLNVGEMDDFTAHQLSQELLKISGVAEAVVIAAEQVAYLKVDKDKLDLETLQKFAV